MRKNIIFNQKQREIIRKKLRKEMPKGEVVLWTRLKNNKIGYKFRRQHSIGRYVVDFYCPELHLAIEVDGRTHDYHDQIIYDKERQKYIESLNIKVMRFYSEEVLKNLNNVVERIYLFCEDLNKQLQPPPVDCDRPTPPSKGGDS